MKSDSPKSPVADLDPMIQWLNDAIAIDSLSVVLSDISDEVSTHY